MHDSKLSKSAVGHVYAYFRQFRGFSRDIWLLLITNFLASVVMGLSSIIQPLYLSAIGYDSATVGVLLGVSAIVSVLVLFPAGTFADRYGRKRIMIVSILLYALAFITYAIRSELSLLLLASVLIGLSWGMYVGPSNAILMDKTGTKERSYVFSLFSFMSAFAFIIGSLLAGATDLVSSTLHQNSLESYRTMFKMSFGLSLSSALMLVFVHEESFAKKNRRMLTIRSWKLIGLFSVTSALIGFGAGVFIPLLPIYIRLKFSVSDAEIGILFAISNAAMGIANLFAPRLSEKIGPVSTITLTQALSVVPLLAISLSRIFNFASLLYVVRTALMNMSSPILNMYTMSVVPKDERASTSGVITMAWNGANAVGTMISGILMNVYLDLPVFVSVLFYSLSSIVFYLSFRNLRQPPKE